MTMFNLDNNIENSSSINNSKPILYSFKLLKGYMNKDTFEL